jgi:CheY-like chemotaxis protein
MKKILIVDRFRFSTLIAKMLPQEIFKTETASDGIDAIRLLLSTRPDIVLSKSVFRVIVFVWLS